MELPQETTISPTPDSLPSSQMPMAIAEFPGYLKTHNVVAKYDPSKEPKLPHPWWEFEKAKVDKQLREFAQLVLKVFVNVPNDDKELDHLQRTANTLSKVKPSNPVRVALVGAQGAGKSLMTNALFSCDGLSLTGADGAACTSAVIRYAHFSDGGDEDVGKFYARIKFLNAKKREEMIKEHARSFHYLHDEEDDSDDEDATHARKRGLEESERRAKDTAEDIFVTLFGSVEKFLDCWSLKTYKSGEFAKICEMKCGMATAKLDINSEGIAQFIGTNQKELIAKIKPFLTKVKGEVCLWPLVDNVKISFRHELLEQGIELVDVPGWGDINLSRVRHAEEIKESVDIELILADTIRIASDDAVINYARAAAAVRGATNVKLIATKIDSLTRNQLDQCTGFPYDQIKEMICEAENEHNRADEEDDLQAKDLISKYILYLQRHLKQAKVIERSKNIDEELSAKFPTQARTDNPEVLHASASNYMDRTKKAHLRFIEQPELPPELTGLPSIRQFLFSLPAQRNLREYEVHLAVTIPSFIEKIRRAIADSDRDTGFRDLAEQFDTIRHEFIKQLRSETKSAFGNLSKNGIARVRADIDAYKQQLDGKISKQWLTVPGPAFKKIVNFKGVVAKGASKARGLDMGCNWNKEIADILAPGFNKWLRFQSRNMRDMSLALSQALDQAHLQTMIMMDNSSANLVVIDKAKKKWQNIHPKMQAKLQVLMKKIEKLHKRFFYWAIMQDARENNLAAHVMDSIFDDVFSSEPATKEITTGKNKGKKRFVMSKVAHQKGKLLGLTISAKPHLVENLIDQFQMQFDQYLNNYVDEHFEDASKLLEGFSETLRKQAPVDYIITPVGETMRRELENLVPTLLEKSQQLRDLLPVVIKEDDDAQFPTIGACAEDAIETVGELFERISKRKRKGEASTPRVRIKKEE